MNGDNYVNRIVASNPRLFSAAKIQLTPESLKKQLRDAFLAGQKDREIFEAELRKNRPASIMENIFGKGIS